MEVILVERRVGVFAKSGDEGYQQCVVVPDHIVYGDGDAVFCDGFSHDRLIRADIPVDTEKDGQRVKDIQGFGVHALADRRAGGPEQQEKDGGGSGVSFPAAAAFLRLFPVSHPARWKIGADGGIGCGNFRVCFPFAAGEALRKCPRPRFQFFGGYRSGLVAVSVMIYLIE